jgi:hypothetical protein
MTSYLRPGEVSAAYEALRAQATGRLAPVTPHGLSLVLATGLAAWVKTWAQREEPPALTPHAVTGPAPVGTKAARAPAGQGAPDGTSGELVRLLAEMALGCWAQLAVTP